MNIIKRLFCRHEYVFERNIYGDEIIHVGWNRSWWRCKKCGKRKLSPYLHDEREHMPSGEARSGESVLVEVAIPLECIGVVSCDFDGIYHAQVLGKEVETDEATYWRVVKARDSNLCRMRDRLRELGIEEKE